MAKLNIDLTMKVNEELKAFYEEHIARLVIENESLKKKVESLNEEIDNLNDYM